MNKQDKYIVPVDLIALFLSGEATTNDISTLEKWKGDSPANLEIFRQYISLWEKSGKLSEMDKIDVEEELKQFHSRIAYTGAIRIRRLSPLVKMAAAILVGVIIGYSSLATWRTIKFESVVARSSIAVVNLPDGSTVTLNTGSSISWPKNFRGEKREVKLDGEAFFEVRRDTLKPFITSSGDIAVEVLGTAFNVEFLKKSGRANVIVEEGRVAVYVENQKEKTEYLSVGDKVTWEPGAKSLVRSVNIDPNFNAWKTRRVFFSNNTMQEVAATLSKVYGRNISAEGYAGNETITVIFENSNLDYVLNTIMATIDIEVEETKSGIILK